MSHRLLNFDGSHLVEFFKYLLASVMALFFDYSCYWLLFKYLIKDQPIAATAGYLCGLIVSYYLLTFYVFRDSWLRQKRHHEILLFLFSGVVGAACTYLTVALYGHFVVEHSHWAKNSAIITSFITVYLLRKFIVFRKAPCLDAELGFHQTNSESSS